jgi:hypothetical protein
MGLRPEEPYNAHGRADVVDGSGLKRRGEGLASDGEPVRWVDLCAA